jgi:hypothetical protein
VAAARAGRVGCARVWSQPEMHKAYNDATYNTSMLSTEAKGSKKVWPQGRLPTSNDSI